MDEFEPGMRPGDELAGQVAIVTGGARNIGRAIACSLAAGGSAVMVNAMTSIDDAGETVKMIEAAGGEAAYFVADVSDEQAVEAMVDATLERFGRLTTVVNNHTHRATALFQETTLEEWQRVIAVVLTGSFLTGRAAVPHMIEAGGGSIVNISGLRAHEGHHAGAHFSAAKNGLEGMTRAAALDLAEHNITVNCVSPGAIDTVRDERAQRAGRAVMGGRIMPPVGRIGHPGEIAAMVRMLCGPDARFVTGQTIHVNGGEYRT